MVFQPIIFSNSTKKQKLKNVAEEFHLKQNQPVNGPKGDPI